VCDSYDTINKKQLDDNRALVRRVVNLRNGKNTDEDVSIVAMSDGAYNNPIKGYRFYQPGTQAWAPCFPGEPGLERIPIAFATKSKICSCRKDHKTDCKKTFPDSQAIGNAEKELGRLLATELMEGDSPLAVKTLVTDGDSSLHKGVQEVMKMHGVETEKGDCTRHVTRSVSRNIGKAKLSDRCLGGIGKKLTAVERNKNKQKLANFIERRCSMEFRAGFDKRKKRGNGLQRLIDSSESIKLSIIGCIQGYTDICRQGSLVCTAHKKKGKEKVIRKGLGLILAFYLALRLGFGFEIRVRFWD